MLGIVMCLTLATSAFAAGNNSTDIPELPTDFGTPVEITTYYDKELEATVTERTYFVPVAQEGGIVLLNDSKGEGWFKKENEFDWQNGKTTTTYAQGYFTWEDGEVSVSSASGGYDYFPSTMEITKEELTTGTGKYAFFFNNYAYVTYTFKFTNFLGNTQDISAKIRVSESGNAI